MKKISILGATGSIGTQTLDVIRKNGELYELIGISIHKNKAVAIQIIEEFKPKLIAVTDLLTYEDVKAYCSIHHSSIKVVFGMDGMIEVSTDSEVELLVTSVVGMIGLLPTMAAINAGKDIALANKETLVAAGQLVMETAIRKKVKILPVDSEHSAIFQSLQGNRLEEIKNIILTASGGPFRGKDLVFLQSVKLKDALKHPKWNMGKKISVDSSTLMNKGLEVIEAHWLFNVAYDDIKTVIHPQSIIHSMVEYIDNSVIAQLGCPDMRLPIQYALNYPHRKEAVANKLDIFNLGSLTFEEPDFNTFRCLKLAYEAGKIGGTMTAILNSANEAAVELFLDEQIKYLKISEIVEDCMNKFEVNSNYTIEEVIELDTKVKSFVRTKHFK